jgi:hypothetical protein
MASLSPEQKARLLVTTRPAALSFVEDMEYIRAMIARVDTNRGELRRLSAILRRILVEGDIAAVAAPRIGRIKLHALDIKPIYNLPTHLRVLFFSGGDATVFGVKFGPQVMLNAGQATSNPNAQAREVAKHLEALNSDRKIELRLDNFLSQRVLCYRGLWASRRAMIKHIANVGSGVHSGAPETEEDTIIERMRSSCWYSVADGKVEVHILPEFGSDSAQLTYTPSLGLPESFTASSLDPILVEMLGTAQLLAGSPDVAALEKTVVDELLQLGLAKNMAQ